MRRAALIGIPVLVGAAFACSSSYSGEDARDAGTKEAGEAPDATPPSDAGGPETTTDAAPDPCDQDRDGFRAATAACGGDDCDDTDARVHPGTADGGFVNATPGATNGDWNCNGTVEKQYPVNVRCSDHVPFPSACSGFSGFTGDPACGATGTFVSCTYPGNGSSCANGASEMRVQGCR